MLGFKISLVYGEYVFVPILSFLISSNISSTNMNNIPSNCSSCWFLVSIFLSFDIIFESKLAETPFKTKITQNISEIYAHLGKKEPYFSHHPSHALRHLGAHYWLAKTNYNYGIIAEVGGWHTIDELKKSYGQIPPEKILEIIE